MRIHANIQSPYHTSANIGSLNLCLRIFGKLWWLLQELTQLGMCLLYMIYTLSVQMIKILLHKVLLSMLRDEHRLRGSHEAVFLTPLI